MKLTLTKEEVFELLKEILPGQFYGMQVTGMKQSYSGELEVEFGPKEVAE